MTTGSTKLKVKDMLENLGFKVIGVVVLLDRNELENGIAASDIIKQQGLKYKAIIDAIELFQVLWLRRTSLKINDTAFSKVKEYYDVYGAKKLLFGI